MHDVKPAGGAATEALVLTRAVLASATAAASSAAEPHATSFALSVRCRTPSRQHRGPMTAALLTFRRIHLHASWNVCNDHAQGTRFEELSSFYSESLREQLRRTDLRFFVALNPVNWEWKSKGRKSSVQRIRMGKKNQGLVRTFFLGKKAAAAAAREERVPVVARRLRTLCHATSGLSAATARCAARRPPPAARRPPPAARPPARPPPAARPPAGPPPAARRPPPAAAAPAAAARRPPPAARRPPPAPAAPPPAPTATPDARRPTPDARRPAARPPAARRRARRPPPAARRPTPAADPERPTPTPDARRPTPTPTPTARRPDARRPDARRPTPNARRPTPDEPNARRPTPDGPTPVRRRPTTDARRPTPDARTPDARRRPASRPAWFATCHSSLLVDLAGISAAGRAPGAEAMNGASAGPAEAAALRKELEGARSALRRQEARCRLLVAALGARPLRRSASASPPAPSARCATASWHGRAARAHRPRGAAMRPGAAPYPAAARRARIATISAQERRAEEGGKERRETN
ncbi:Synembryn-A [Gryllus bimaculatus]|nr:Synembryn-A [Gryllus bimaculatus]